MSVNSKQSKLFPFFFCFMIHSHREYILVRPIYYSGRHGNCSYLKITLLFEDLLTAKKAFAIFFNKKYQVNQRGSEMCWKVKLSYKGNFDQNKVHIGKLCSMHNLHLVSNFPQVFSNALPFYSAYGVSANICHLPIPQIPL